MMVWIPLSQGFRRAIQKATETAFIGRNVITTTFGETILLEDIERYNQRAEGPLATCFHKLDSIGRSDIVHLVQVLYPRLIPYFIGCGTKNPVHHTAYVIEYMAEILIGEGKGRTPDLTIGILAALFHDVAQGRSKLHKITEANIKDKIREVVHRKATLDDLEEYRDNAVRARQEHMHDGASIAGSMLQAYRCQHPGELTDEIMDQVTQIIEHHDDPKIPVTYRVIRDMFDTDSECKAWRTGLDSRQEDKLASILAETGAEYLIQVDDWLLQVHHEADLLWMVTQDGIDADLARFSPAEAKTPREIIDNNKSLHKRERELYRDRPDFAAYGFQGGTAYRSQTGFALFESLTQVLDDRYPLRD